MKHQHNFQTSSCTTQSAKDLQKRTGKLNHGTFSPHGPREATKVKQDKRIGKKKSLFSNGRGHVRLNFVYYCAVYFNLRKLENVRGGGKEGEKKEAVDRQARIGKRKKREKKKKIVRYILFFPSAISSEALVYRCRVSAAGPTS